MHIIIQNLEKPMHLQYHYDILLGINQMPAASLSMTDNIVPTRNLPIPLSQLVNPILLLQTLVLTFHVLPYIYTPNFLTSLTSFMRKL